jgi:glutathione S-transferase
MARAASGSMRRMKLYIGNKNYSSWSMRPWVALRAAGIAFDEHQLWFDDSLAATSGPEGSFRAQLTELTGSATVPVLEVAPNWRIVDSLAIIEYAAEAFPAAPLWPRDAKLRSLARSAAAQMHSGFGAIRQNLPMNIEASLPDVGARILSDKAEFRAQVARVQTLWAQLQAVSGGPFLGGVAFGAVDAFFAPMCMRFVTYGVPLDAAAQAYVAQIIDAPAVRQWCDEARLECRFVAVDEPYRQQR